MANEKIRHWFRSLPEAGQTAAVRDIERMLAEEVELRKRLADLHNLIREKNEEIARDALTVWSVEDISDAVFNWHQKANRPADEFLLLPACLQDESD